MKKAVALSALAWMIAASGNAADTLSAMFTEGKASGQIREFSISRSVEDTRPGKDEYTRKANAIGGHLKFETGAYHGLSFGTAFYTTNGLFVDSQKRLDYTETDPSLLGAGNEGYSIIGEAYVQYIRGNTTFKGGRQVLNTPLAGTDDTRMLPNLFEAYLLINTDIPDTTLIAGHVTQFAQGTFGRVYTGGVLAVSAGYSATDPREQVGDFENMGTYAIGQSTDGVSVVSATYTGLKNTKLQFWDYYAHDILNAVYLQADTSWTCLLSDKVFPYASVQLINENDAGDSLAGKIDTTYWAAKFGAKFADKMANVSVAYSQNDDNTDSFGTGAIITPWGGMPAFTQGMVTRHMFLGGTEAFKVAGSYSFKNLGTNLNATLYYTSFDMNDNNGYSTGHSWTATEAGFDVIYYPEMVKNLQLRLRGNFPSEFFENNDGAVSWNEYRFIVNYNF